MSKKFEDPDLTAVPKDQNMARLQQMYQSGQITEAQWDDLYDDMEGDRGDTTGVVRENEDPSRIGQMLDRVAGDPKYSIQNTRNMPWENQVSGYFDKNGTIKSSDSLYIGESNVDGVKNAPLYIPTSVITKAIRTQKGSRSAHELEKNDILKLKDGIKNAPVVIDNPARNAIIYVTGNTDARGNYIVAVFDKNNILHGENAHRAVSVYGRDSIKTLLESLGEDATVFVNNESKLNEMLSGNQIYRSLELLAKVELAGDRIADNGLPVKVRFSLEAPVEQTGT
ncbi:MAG: hypothetical protein HUJ67_02345, partial [Ruminiclostridium sp.]|nr:hypothetical protein [Ruminiclostridium sp.]